jgi:hypothetical protein
MHCAGCRIVTSCHSIQCTVHPRVAIQLCPPGVLLPSCTTFALNKPVEDDYYAVHGHLVLSLRLLSLSTCMSTRRTPLCHPLAADDVVQILQTPGDARDASAAAGGRAITAQLESQQCHTHGALHQASSTHRRGETAANMPIRTSGRGVKLGSSNG